MTEIYLDRSHQLFGREKDIKKILNRTKEPGLTIIVARPLMGKTWTLNEVGRQLNQEGDYVIGYHESMGCENSHLLYAVSNLYAC